MQRWFLLLPLAVSVVSAAIIPNVIQALNSGDFPLAEEQVSQYERTNGTTPEMLEALSWIARAALINGQLDRAETDAAKTYRLCQAELKKRTVDSDPHLATALGAVIEVHAEVFVKQGKRAPALQYLRGQYQTYRATSVAERIQKNINLLSLEGRPAPQLLEARYLGPKPVPLSALRGKPVLLFFWAHWCGDCRAEAPLIADIRREFGPKGLVVAGPTRLYGYTATEENASPAEEMKFIEAVRERFYSGLEDVPMPLSAENFRRYGASTTPTLVLIDRKGIVRLYHPGAMDPAELRAAVQKITG